jgi:hypothetical protein
VRVNQDFAVIENCFIRDKKCGRILGGSTKLAFVASPDADSVVPQLTIIKSKLRDHGLEPYVAAENRAYGKDIFCEKICGKIIESKICIVLLDDVPGEDEKPITNPNVYYEYGIMTSLCKKIIPLQRKGAKLAFNIQSLDTIKYTNRTLSDELDTAIKSYVVESKAVDKQQSEAVPRNVNLYLSIKGFNWPKLIKGSDIEYAVTLGVDLGFFLLVDFLNNGLLYFSVLKTDKDEEHLLLNVKALLKRLEAVHHDILKQKKRLEGLASFSASFATPQMVTSIDAEQRRQLEYLKQLVVLFSNTKLLIYRSSFKDRENVVKYYDNIELSLKKPELIIVDSAEVQSFLNQ